MEATAAGGDRAAARLGRGGGGGAAAAAARVSGAGRCCGLGRIGCDLDTSRGAPCCLFYRWQGPLGRPKTWPQIWTNSGRFRSPETYPKTASFSESELNSQNLPCLLGKLALPFKETWQHLLWNHPDFSR